MHTISKPSTPTWAKALEPATEFPSTALPLLCGQVPDGLRGTLYRNGPARLERGGIKVGHWFDGDGAVLAVHFTPVGATGVYRYVQTDQFGINGSNQSRTPQTPRYWRYRINYWLYGKVATLMP